MKQIEIDNKVAAHDSMQAKVEVAEANVKEAEKVHAQLSALLASGVLVKDEAGNLKPFLSQEQQQMNQSQIPVLKRSESGLSHGSQASYAASVRKAAKKYTPGGMADNEMSGQ